jgi:hypothetical protein
MATPSRPKACWICGRIIRLEDCTIDHHGLGVHERCYVAKMMLAKAASVRQPEHASLIATIT